MSGVKVRMLTSLADARGWTVSFGDVHAFDAATAARLVESGQAEYVDAAKPPRERATRSRRETAVTAEPLER